VHNAIRGVEVVYHLGALGSVPRSVQDPLTSSAVNVEGTLNVLLAARDEGVRRVVFASSSSVYGDADGFPRDETQRPQPLSPYGVAKLAAESYCRAFWQVYGLETVSLRYFNVFGPRQDPHSQYAAVVPRFIARLLDGKPPVIYGDGNQSRDFTYVGNVVAGNLLAASAPDVAGEVLNVATGGSLTVNELSAAIQETLGVDIEPVYEPARVGEVEHSAADISRAERLLGYGPAHGVEEGLVATAESLRSGSLIKSES
jgi:UDP-glucose 4-epimerase